MESPRVEKPALFYFGGMTQQIVLSVSGADVNLAAMRSPFSAVLLACLLCPPFCGIRGQAAEPQRLTVGQGLKRNQSNIPVRVSGVVTAADPVRIFIQDETGGIGIFRAALRGQVEAGDLVEVSGATTGSGAGLGISGQSLVKTGKAELPKPQAISAERLEASDARHQRVRIAGTVHEVAASGEVQILQVQSGNASFMVMWQASPPEQPDRVLAPRLDLLDADVELEGVAMPQFSPAGLRSGFRLFLASSEPPHLKVLRAGSSDVFTRPLRTLASLKGLKAHDNQRWLVRGVVTYWSDAGWFHLQDGTGTGRGNNAHFLLKGIGWPYRTGRSEPNLKPGDEIELVGMPVITAGGHVSLSRCEWRVTGHVEPPPFAPASAEQILKADMEGASVSITGRVVDVEITTDYQGFAVHTLWMESGETGFAAMVQKRRQGEVPVQPGQYARVEGVVTTSPGVIGKAAFRINVNDFPAIRAVPPPPFWQTVNLMRWLGAAGGVIGLFFIWILMLRRQVAAQTAQLRDNARRLEDQLEQERELSEARSRFVFTVSHEFRNPLAAIMSCSDVLQRLNGRMSQEEHAHQITGIQQNVRRMADMMEEVLLLGRAESGRLPCETRPLDLAAFCRKLADQILSASAGRCPVDLAVTPGLPPLMLDAGLLQHIAGNLLGNAVKYSPAGMSVEFRADYQNGVCALTIRDRGPGIPTLDRPRIFEPFHRGSNVDKTAGTGLGLAIAERCARAHGGGITCESDSGEGTTFTVRIPCEAASDPTPP